MCGSLELTPTEFYTYILLSLKNHGEDSKGKKQTGKNCKGPISPHCTTLTITLVLLYTKYHDIWCLMHKTLLPEKNSGYFNGSFVPVIKSMVKLCLPEFSDFTIVFLRLKFYAIGPFAIKIKNSPFLRVHHKIPLHRHETHAS